MKGAITSIESRSAGDILIFEIDETNYSPETRRIVTKDNVLDGTVLTTNWGYPEGNRLISLDNIFLSRSNYDTLIIMKEDDNYDFLFGYLSDIWAVVIENIRGRQEKDKMLTRITLSVISKYSAMESA